MVKKIQSILLGFVATQVSSQPEKRPEQTKQIYYIGTN